MYGVIAQKVERMNGIHKVTGSIPVNSTKIILKYQQHVFDHQTLFGLD